MQVTETRTVPGLGTFTVVHEVKERKAWRIPSLPNGTNKAGGAKCHAPKTWVKVPRPSPKLPEGEKFMKALKLRAELVAKIAGTA
jgi:hypothetical protein